MEIEPGAVFSTPAPFTRKMYQKFDEDGHYEVPSWTPGARAENFGDDGINRADAEGSVEYRVVSRHRPPGFPERVFYVRTFVAPSGVRFDGAASRKLRSTPLYCFRKLIQRWPAPYSVDRP